MSKVNLVTVPTWSEWKKKYFGQRLPLVWKSEHFVKKKQWEAWGWRCWKCCISLDTRTQKCYCCCCFKLKNIFAMFENVKIAISKTWWIVLNSFFIAIKYKDSEITYRYYSFKTSYLHFSGGNWLFVFNRLPGLLCNWWWCFVEIGGFERIATISFLGFFCKQELYA